jgi:hypothetical protein
MNDDHLADSATADDSRSRLQITPVQRILDRLCGVQRSGAGWKALCPAHRDQHPSLSVGTGNDGRALVYCHAGCDVRVVVAAVGLTLRDLFPRNRGSYRGRGA